MPEQAEQLQQILQTVEAADFGLGEDLWLIAERIMLYRLTRAGEQKRVELAAMVHTLRRIMSETQGELNIPIELVSLDDSAKNEFRGDAESNLSLVFTTIVDMAENMSSHQLYLLISALRKMDLPAPQEISVEPLEKTEAVLNEDFQEDNEWTFQ
jgi:hypothetical protein